MEQKVQFFEEEDSVNTENNNEGKLIASCLIYMEEMRRIRMQILKIPSDINQPIAREIITKIATFAAFAARKPVQLPTNIRKDYQMEKQWSQFVLDIKNNTKSLFSCKDILQDKNCIAFSKEVEFILNGRPMPNQVEQDQPKNNKDVKVQSNIPEQQFYDKKPSKLESSMSQSHKRRKIFQKFSPIKTIINNSQLRNNLQLIIHQPNTLSKVMIQQINSKSFIKNKKQTPQQSFQSSNKQFKYNENNKLQFQNQRIFFRPSTPVSSKQLSNYGDKEGRIQNLKSNSFLSDNGVSDASIVQSDYNRNNRVKKLSQFTQQKKQRKLIASRQTLITAKEQLSLPYEQLFRTPTDYSLFRRSCFQQRSTLYEDSIQVSCKISKVSSMRVSLVVQFRNQTPQAVQLQCMYLIPKCFVIHSEGKVSKQLKLTDQKKHKFALELLYIPAEPCVLSLSGVDQQGGYQLKIPLPLNMLSFIKYTPVTPNAFLEAWKASTMENAYSLSRHFELDGVMMDSETVSKCFKEYFSVLPQIQGYSVEELGTHCTYGHIEFFLRLSVRYDYVMTMEMKSKNNLNKDHKEMLEYLLDMWVVMLAKGKSLEFEEYE